MHIHVLLYHIRLPVQSRQYTACVLYIKDTHIYLFIYRSGLLIWFHVVFRRLYSIYFFQMSSYNSKISTFLTFSIMRMSTRNSSWDQITRTWLVTKCGVGQDHECGRILSAVAGIVNNNLHPECEVPYSNDFRNKQGVLKLMVGHFAPIYHLHSNVISAAVGLVYSNLQSKYELRSSTHFGQFQKFGINQFGALSPTAL